MGRRYKDHSGIPDTCPAIDEVQREMNSISTTLVGYGFSDEADELEALQEKLEALRKQNEQLREYGNEMYAAKQELEEELKQTKDELQDANDSIAKLEQQLERYDA